MKKCADYIMIALILIMIAIPVFTFNWKPDQISVVENRKLAEPVSPREGLTTSMRSITDAVNDRIGYRDEMMQMYNKWAYGIMEANHSDVIRGKDGWLFYNEDLPDYTGANVDPASTEYQVSVISAINDWCKERGITFVLAIGPNKSSIYHEYMPDTIMRCEKSSVDYAVEALREKGILVSYPKEKMLLHKNETDLYYRLDTHWNSYGAKFMMDDLVELLDLPEYEFTYTESYLDRGDLLDMLGTSFPGAYSLYAGVTENPQSELEAVGDTSHKILHSEGKDKIVCYRDSFHDSILPYYGYYFDGPVWWKFSIDFDQVEQEAPKYLIFECVERYFNKAVYSNAGILNAEQ